MTRTKVGYFYARAGIAVYFAPYTFERLAGFYSATVIRHDDNGLLVEGVRTDADGVAYGEVEQFYAKAGSWTVRGSKEGNFEQHIG